MAQKIREVMTRDPRTIDASSPVVDAARVMREADVGPVIVTEGDKICGIVTDRDVAVRAVAQGRDPKSTPVREICSSDLITLSPDDSVGEAVRLMRERNVRRLAVLEGNKPVGIVAIGDLAVERDPSSVLGNILRAAFAWGQPVASRCSRTSAIACTVLWNSTARIPISRAPTTFSSWSSRKTPSSGRTPSRSQVSR